MDVPFNESWENSWMIFDFIRVCRDLDVDYSIEKDIKQRTKRWNYQILENRLDLLCLQPRLLGCFMSVQHASKSLINISKTRLGMRK